MLAGKSGILYGQCIFLNVNIFSLKLFEIKILVFLKYKTALKQSIQQLKFQKLI